MKVRSGDILVRPPWGQRVAKIHDSAVISLALGDILGSGSASARRQRPRLSGA